MTPNPYFSVRANRIAWRIGKIPVKIRPPSNGRTGIRLNVISEKLNNTAFNSIRTTVGAAEKAAFCITPSAAKAIKAKTKFIAGPAKATQTISLFGFFRREKSTGTGFAHPKTNDECDNTKTNGNNTVPTGSTCRNGFSVNRRASRAVVSPKRSATNPCAISCKTTPKTTGTAHSNVDNNAAAFIYATFSNSQLLAAS